MTEQRTTKRKTSSLPPQIHSLSRDRDGFIRIMIYGEPGVGKTPLAATAPNALILDGDGGLESALASRSKAKVWTLNDWNDALEAYEWLRAGGHKKFDWLVFDSLTLFQERGLDNIMDDLVAVKSHRKVYLPDKGEFGQNMNRLTRFLRDLKRLPMNQVWTAHAILMDLVDPEGNTYERMMPQIQGKGMTNKICGYVGVVGHIEVRTKRKDGEDVEVPYFTTRKRGGWYGKDRYSAIGEMRNPTIPKIIAAIEAKLDPTQANTEGE